MDYSDLVQTPATTPEAGFGPPPPDQVGAPPVPPPVQPPKPKPYHQVLWEHKMAQANGLPPDMSVPEFSQHMNNITGTQDYNEGLNDSPLRRAAANIDVGLRHFGGAPAPASPPGTPWWKAQSLSEALGGTNEGFNVPEATGHVVKGFMRDVLGVQSPQLLEAGQQAGEQLPSAGLTVGAGALATAATGGTILPLMAMGGTAAFQTYGETGRALPSAISGVTTMAIPKAAEMGGQAFLRGVGAKTVAEIAPETVAKMTAADAAKIGSQYAPATGWGPTALTQRAVRLAGAQTGMLAAGEVGGATQILADPNQTWHDKLASLGHEFSPAGLAATAISQAPFTVMDLFNERTHPLKHIDDYANASFDANFQQAYAQDRAKMGVTGEGAQATPEQIASAKQRVVDAKVNPKPEVAPTDKPDGAAAPVVSTPTPVEPLTPQAAQMLSTISDTGVMPSSRNAFLDKLATDNGIELKPETTAADIVQGLHEKQFEANKPQNVEGRVLASMGMSPLSGDWDKLKINTAEGSWSAEEARQAVLGRANLILNAKASGLRATDAQNNSVYMALNTLKDLHLPKNTILHMAGNLVADGMTQSKTNLERAGSKGITAEEQAAQIRNEPYSYGPGHDVKAETDLDRQIVDKISQYVQDPHDPNKTIPNPNYSQETHQLIALLSGDTGSWREAGIDPDKVMMRATGPTEEVTREFPGSDPLAPGETEQVKVRRATSRVQPLQTSFIDKITGLAPKPEDKARNIQAEISVLENRITEFLRQGGNPEDRALEPLVGQLQDLVKLEEAVSNETRGGRARSIIGDTTFAARKAAFDFKKRDGTPFDVTNPDDVGEYYSAIRKAVNTAEMGYLRERESEPWITNNKGDAIPGEPALRITSGKEALALASELNSNPNKPNHINYTVPRGPDKQPLAEPDGSFRIVKNTFRQLYPMTPEEEAVSAQPKPPEIVEPKSLFEVLTQLGADMRKIEQSQVLNAFSELRKRFADSPGEREGRIAALAQNIIDGVSAIDGKELSNFIEDKAALKTNSLRNRDIWKQRFIAYIEWLQYGGQIKMEVTHPAQGVVRVEGVGDLDGFNNYLKSKDPDFGLKESFQLNQRGTKDVSLNFFERFHILSELLRQMYYDPRNFKALTAEKRPLGAWRWLPPNFWEDPEKHITIQGAGAIGQEKGHFPKLGEFVEGDQESKEGVLTLQDRQGKDVKFLVPHNPLITFHVKAMNKELTTAARTYVDMFKNYARYKDENGQWQSLVPQRMLDLAEGLMEKLPYLRDLRVGSGIAINPFVHGFFHTDDLGSSAGILMSPFRPDYTHKNAALLMKPDEIFGHFLHELGHGATQFAYARDAAFKKQVDEIYAYLKQYHEANKNRVGSDAWSQDQMHALSSPEELLAAVFHDGQTDPRYAGQFHRWLKDIPDMLPPLPNTVPGSIFDRIFNMIRGLFERFTNNDQTATMLDRLSSLAARGADISADLGLQGRGNIYDQMKAIELKKGQDIIHRPFPNPQAVPKNLNDINYWWGRPWAPEEHGPMSLLEVLKDREGAYADAKKEYNNVRDQALAKKVLVSAGMLPEQNVYATTTPAQYPELYNLLVQKAEQLNLRRAELEEVQKRVGERHLITDSEAASYLGWYKDTQNGVRGFRDRQTKAFTPYDQAVERLNAAKVQEWQQRTGGKVLESREQYWTPEELLQGVEEAPPSERGNFPRYLVKADGETKELNTTAQLAKWLGVIRSTPPRVFRNAGKGITIDFDTNEPNTGRVMESRSVPDTETENVDVPKPLLPVQGRKTRLLADPVMNNIVRTAVNGRTVVDAFAGSGVTAVFSKVAGAKHVILNVKDPAAYQMWNDMHQDPEGFGQRVANVVKNINSTRTGPVRMRDGSSVIPYLDGVERRDPNVGRFVKQALNYMGREYPLEGKFTPAPTMVNSGLIDLPNRIREFAAAVDEVRPGDGWAAVKSVQPGQVGTVDPSYVGERGRYGEGKITPEQRIAEYEQNMYPNARKGAFYVVFDLAHPQLVKSLTDNGFHVQPYQRTTQGGKVVRQELVAFNHEDPGRMLESRANTGQVLDAMRSGATNVVEDRDKIWLHPYSLRDFGDLFRPAFGDRLQLEQRGGQWGYAVDKLHGFGTLMQSDVDAMPRRPPNPYAPTAYETLYHNYRMDGSDEATSKALAQFQLQFTGVLRNSEDSMWGIIPKGTAAGRAWGYGAKLIGLAPFTQSGVAGVPDTRVLVLHEGAHGAGINPSDPRYGYTTPDVQRAYQRVSSIFKTMSPEQREDIIKGLARQTYPDIKNPWIYDKALTNPEEFAAEFMGHIGDTFARTPEPSVYLRNTLRFAPDDLSNLLQLQVMRQSQGLEGLRKYTEQQAIQRGTGPNSTRLIIDQLASIFKGLLRPTLDIAKDQMDFNTMRLLFPDTYRPLMINFGEEMARRGAQHITRYAKVGGDTSKVNRDFPEVPGRVLEAQEPDYMNYVREFFRYPTPNGNLPVRLSIWDRFLTQFQQFAEKYPMARPFYYMLSAARAMTQAASRENQTALAGVYSGTGKLQDDVRTQHIARFYRSAALQAAFNKIGLELQSLGDAAFDKEYQATNKNIMAMDPGNVTGWMTPQLRDAQMKKLGITNPKDREALETVLQGVQNQYAHANQLIGRSKLHDLSTMVAKAISVNTDFRPEQGRQMAQDLIDGFNQQAVDPNIAQAAFDKFAAQLNNPELNAKLFDLASSQFADIQKLSRFLDLRLPYFMSERRPGKFGVTWKDDSGNIRSWYEKDAVTRDKYIARNNITPIRVTNPQDPNWGISQDMWEVMDQSQKRMVEKLSNILGATEAKRLAPLMDMSTDLKDSLNARDILKLTVRRELAPGREELNMFDTSQHYMRSVINAVRNRFIKNEAELLFTNPEFDTQPYLKDYVQGHIQNTVLTPDSQAGRLMQQMSFFYYLFMNPSSMLMQMSHQVMGLAPKLTELGASVSGSFGTIKNANQMVVDAMRNKGVYKDKEIGDMIQRMKDAGVIVSTFARELDHAQDLSIANRMRVTDGRAAITPFDLLKNKMYQGYLNMRRLYDIIPTYNSEVAAVAALLHLRSPEGGGLHGDELYNQAQFVKDITMYPGGKENRPGYFQYLPRSAAQALWSLETYANGLTTMLGNLIRKSVNPAGAGLTPAQAAQTRKAAVQMLITQIAVAGVAGLPFYQGMMLALQKMFPEHNIEGSVRQTLQGLAGDDEHLGNLIGNTLMTGVPSATDWAPDVSSRFALSGVFHVSPYSGVDWQQLMGASGGILARFLQAGQAGLRGDPMGLVQEMMPNGFQRVWKSLEQGHNYVTGSGRLLVNDLSPFEIAARTIGFTPGRVAKLQTAERMQRLTTEANKADTTRFVKEQAQMLEQQRDREVQANITNRVAQTKGTDTAEKLGSDIAQEFERRNMPFDPRRLGNRSTILAQKSLRSLYPPQVGLPTNIDRLQLQQMIAQRLGLRGPSMGSYRHASSVDSLLQMYPHLTVPQANLLLTHAAGSRPSYDLYQELLSGGE